MISIFRSDTTNLGEAVKLIFQLLQHERDEQLMRSLIKDFGCGNISKNRKAFYFKVTKFQDIAEKVIRLFKKYPIHGVKTKDFADLCLVASMMQEKNI